MSWARIDDGLHSHRKARLGRPWQRALARLAARGLWALALSYSADQSSDGFIEGEWMDETLSPLPARWRQSIMAQAVETGLLERLEAGETRTVEITERVVPEECPTTIELGPFEEPGYLIHDYLQLNPSRAEVESRRGRQRQKKASGRAAQRQSRLPWDRAVSPGDASGRAAQRQSRLPWDRAVSPGDTPGDSPGASLSTRPVPDPEKTEVGGGSRAKRGRTPPPDRPGEDVDEDEATRALRAIP